MWERTSTKRTIEAVLVLLATLSLISLSRADFFPLKDLAPGMRGEVWTVMKGAKPTVGTVEIVDVLPHGAPGGGTMILAVLTGDVDYSAGGMSGSPVFINGKLLGALSIAYLNVYRGNRLIGITYIGDMVGDLPKERGISTPPTFVFPDGRALWEEGGKVRVWKGEEAAIGVSGRTYSLNGVLLSPPIFVAGADRSFAEEMGKRWGVNAFPLGSSGDSDDGISAYARAEVASRLKENLEKTGYPLSPGDSFFAAVSWGFVKIYSFGTVTYVEDGEFVGWGHGEGDSWVQNAPVFAGWIDEVVRNRNNGFKIGRLVGEPIGSLLFNGKSGVGGSFNVEPPFAVKVVVRANTPYFSEERVSWTVADERCAWAIPSVIAASERIRNLSDRSPRTLRYRFTVKFSNSQKVSEEGVLSGTNVGWDLAGRVERFLRTAVYWPFSTVYPVEVAVEMNEEPVENYYYVRECRLNGKLFGSSEVERKTKAGETVKVSVSLGNSTSPKPLDLDLTLPNRTGTYYLLVASGSGKLSPFGRKWENNARNLYNDVKNHNLSLVSGSLREALNRETRRLNPNQIGVFLVKEGATKPTPDGEELVPVKVFTLDAEVRGFWAQKLKVEKGAKPKK